MIDIPNFGAVAGAVAGHDVGDDIPTMLINETACAAMGAMSFAVGRWGMRELLRRDDQEERGLCP
jgi:hypothetical protein